MLHYLGEFETAIDILLQASEVFPDEYEIEYRLAGLYYMLGEKDKGKFHLTNALHLNFNNHTILDEFFPVTWEMEEVQQQIENFKLK